MLVLMPALVFSCSGLIDLSPLVSAEESRESSHHGETLSEEYIENLNRTRLLNHDSVYEQLSLEAAKKPRRQTKEFITADPFNPPYEQSFKQLKELKYPIPQTQELFEINEKKGNFLFRGQESVLRWFSEAESNTEVCALRFEDESRVAYRLLTFSKDDVALSAGHVVTHAGHCGTCSSLKDLAIYMTNRDLTTAARTCGRKRNAKKIKSCLLEDVGFSEHCAETWTYNVLHTTEHCTSICIKHYGFWHVLRNKFDKPHTDSQGNLNPCLQCDENTSGPGFKYVAGRTRRNSGIISSIHRKAEEIHTIDHSIYFLKE